MIITQYEATLLHAALCEFDEVDTGDETAVKALQSGPALDNLIAKLEREITRG